MPAYGGKRGSELVARVGGEAPLAGEGLLSAGEGRLEPREEPVYRGGEPADLVPRVRHRQPLGEVALAHLSGGARHGLAPRRVAEGGFDGEGVDVVGGLLRELGRARGGPPRGERPPPDGVCAL